MTDGYDIITEISTTYNSEHSSDHVNTRIQHPAPLKKQILFVSDGLNAEPPNKKKH